jgi:hypothetical protein
MIVSICGSHRKNVVFMDALDTFFSDKFRERFGLKKAGIDCECKSKCDDDKRL